MIWHLTIGLFKQRASGWTLEVPSLYDELLNLGRRCMLTCARCSRIRRRIFVVTFVQGLPREQFVFDMARMSISGIRMTGEEDSFEAPLPEQF
jgi:hypothetical protein